MPWTKRNEVTKYIFTRTHSNISRTQLTATLRISTQTVFMVSLFCPLKFTSPYAIFSHWTFDPILLCTLCVYIFYTRRRRNYVKANENWIPCQRETWTKHTHTHTQMLHYLNIGLYCEYKKIFGCLIMGLLSVEKLSTNSSSCCPFTIFAEKHSKRAPTMGIEHFIMFVISRRLCMGFCF